MKKKRKYFNVIIIFNFLVLTAITQIIASCEWNRSLSKRKAGKILEEHFSKNIFVGNITIGKIQDEISSDEAVSKNPCSKLFESAYYESNHYGDLVKDGFIVVKPVSKKQGWTGFILTCDVELTEKTQTFLLKITDGESIRKAEVNIGSVELLEITGVTKSADFFGEVVCSVAYKILLKPTQIGKALGAKDGIFQNTAKFVLYSDGWRLEYSNVHFF